MDVGSVTTPFGRRPMSLAMLAAQFGTCDVEAGKSIDKWKLYRAICEARPRLGVTDRALALLNALLSFYPRAELSEDGGLVVFPSNAQLSLRAHGMPEQTMRRHLAALVAAGLLIRKDSPNGKRYAHKDKGGAVRDAFGFSLAPLLARAEEIEQLAASVVAERFHLQRLKERLTLYRRDITKLVATAVDGQAEGDWTGVITSLQDILFQLPRVPNADQLEATLEQIAMLRAHLVNRLESQIKINIPSANPHQSERHIQRSESESFIETDATVEDRTAQTLEDGRIDQAIAQAATPEALCAHETKGATGPLKAVTLSLVLQACPQIGDYAAGGSITGWRDLTSAATVVRSMLGVSSSAYEEACSVMGTENAAVVMACILERGGDINSAGGYLRDLTRRAKRAEFALAPMLMACLRANASPPCYDS